MRSLKILSPREKFLLIGNVLVITGMAISSLGHLLGILDSEKSSVKGDQKRFPSDYDGQEEGDYKWE